MGGVLESERVWDEGGGGDEWRLGGFGYWGGQDQGRWLWERGQDEGQGEWRGELEGWGVQGWDGRPSPGERRVPAREMRENRTERREKVGRREKTLRRGKKVGVLSSTVLVLTVDHGSKWMRECAAYYGVC